MTRKNRPVDLAMAAERPEKRVVRDLWINEAERNARAFPDDDETLYLTLCGGEGREIRLLADRGIIELTEVGGISDKDRHRVVAIESDLPNALKLQKQFPGLKILEEPVQNILRGDRPTRWPESERERYCRARVINLDLNAPLAPKEVDGAVEFPLINWVSKFAQLHAVAPRRDWSLCLTLHGEIAWSQQASEFCQQFLTENFGREARFADGCRRLLGDELTQRITQQEPIDFGVLKRHSQQQVLMAVVPKLITQAVISQGWRIKTERNLRYGQPPHAAMVTWVVRFTWDNAARRTPDRVYRESIAGILESAAVILDDGNIAADG